LTRLKEQRTSAHTMGDLLVWIQVSQVECQLDFVYVFKRKTSLRSITQSGHCKFRLQVPTQAESYSMEDALPPAHQGAK